MNKFMKVLAASALVATALVGCGKSSTYAKAGLGVVTSMGHSNAKEVNTTFAAIGLDSDGKIQWIDIDVAQGVPADNELTQTKKERKEDYGMKNASPIQKEWNEQAAAFEEFCKGKTPEEVGKIAVNDEGKPTDADLTAGCTITITDMQKAVVAAGNNSQEVETDSLSLGRVMSYEADYGKDANEYLTTDLALVAKDADGKIQWVDIETAKIKNDGSELRTKTEQQKDYNMAAASPIQKEWFEQVAALEAALIGKTADDVAKLAGDDGKATDADIAAGCTITVNAFQAALEKAMK